jgi:hypothetical protein
VSLVPEVSWAPQVSLRALVRKEAGYKSPDSARCEGVFTGSRMDTIVDAM